MKKILALSLLLVSGAIFVPSAEAKDISGSAAALNVEPQRIYQTRRINRRGVRIVNRTRIVRVGRQRYREVVQYRYLPNGRVNVRVISRTRIR
jgi:hypothetical protein